MSADPLAKKLFDNSRQDNRSNITYNNNAAATTSNCNPSGVTATVNLHQAHGLMITEDKCIKDVIAASSGHRLGGTDKLKPAATNTPITPATSCMSISMPTTTVVSTTAMSTVTFQSGTGSVMSTTAMTMTTSSTTEDNVPPAASLSTVGNSTSSPALNAGDLSLDGKRKTPMDHLEELSPKRRNVTEDSNINTPAQMEFFRTLLTELSQIKSEVRIGNQCMNEKMEEIRTENNAWKSKLCALESDVSEMKTTVAEVKSSLQTKISERKTEATAALNTVAALNTKFDGLEEKYRTDMLPIEQLKSQFEDHIGNLEFPVK